MAKAIPLDNTQIGAYKSRVRRKPGSLLPIEIAVCTAAAELRGRGVEEFHGYELAKSLSDLAERRLLTAYGTLYRALGRLERMALLHSRREDPHIAADENRPRRRLYTLTALGEAAVKERSTTAPVRTMRRARRRWVPA
jgi:hypothetical protein